MPASPAVPWIRVERDPARYEAVVRKGAKLGPLRGPWDVYTLLGPVAATEDQEVVYVVLIGTHGECRGVQEIARGARDHVGFDFPDMMRAAVISGTRYLVLCHNHPSGSAIPSEDDAELTVAAEVACFEAGLMLLDHDVLGLGEVYSFREDALYRVNERGRPVRVPPQSW